MNEPSTAKPRIAICDVIFAHATNMSNGSLDCIPKPFEWDRDAAASSDTVVCTDNNVRKHQHRPGQTAIAMLMESPDQTPKAYAHVRKNHKAFGQVLTFSKRLLDTLPNAQFYPLGGSWILPGDWRVYPKSKNVSIIASSKRHLQGHRVRHKCIAKYGSRIDWIGGGGYQPFDYKLQGHKDFRYSIVIENCRQDYYFTEKLIDCLACGSVPIYWGCPSIGDFFNMDGIITFERSWHLPAILETLSEADYERRLPAIRDNMERARKYAVTEEHIWPLLQKHAIYK